jgi:hypothetical protein
MSADIEARAREMGWRPLDEFRGKPDNWVDAETYVERGESFLPIVKAQKAELEKEVAKLRGQVGELTESFRGSQEAIKALEEFYSEETKRQVEKARRDLRAQIKRARDEGDVDAELDAQDELTKLDAAERKAAGNAEPNDPRANKRADPPPLDPAYLAWQAENDWFLKDVKKNRRANIIAIEVKEDNPTLTGKAFFDAVDKRLVEEGIKEGRAATSKVEGGSESRGGGSVKVAGYADLPAEARAACDRQGKALIGKDPRFKTEADWRKYYVELYSKEY